MLAVRSPPPSLTYAFGRINQSARPSWSCSRSCSRCSSRVCCMGTSPGRAQRPGAPGHGARGKQLHGGDIGKELASGCVAPCSRPSPPPTAPRARTTRCRDSCTPVSRLVTVVDVLLGEVVFARPRDQGLLQPHADRARRVRRRPHRRTNTGVPRQADHRAGGEELIAVHDPRAARVLARRAGADRRCRSSRSHRRRGRAHGLTRSSWPATSIANNDKTSRRSGATRRSTTSPPHRHDGQPLRPRRSGPGAGGCSRAADTPMTEGTVPTDTPLFAMLTIGTILIVGALSSTILALRTNHQHLACGHALISASSPADGDLAPGRLHRRPGQEDTTTNTSSPSTSAGPTGTILDDERERDHEPLRASRPGREAWVCAPATTRAPACDGAGRDESRQGTAGCAGHHHVLTTQRQRRHRGPRWRRSTLRIRPDDCRTYRGLARCDQTSARP